MNYRSACLFLSFHLNDKSFLQVCQQKNCQFEMRNVLTGGFFFFFFLFNDSSSLSRSEMMARTREEHGSIMQKADAIKAAAAPSVLRPLLPLLRRNGAIRSESLNCVAPRER